MGVQGVFSRFSPREIQALNYEETVTGDGNRISYGRTISPEMPTEPHRDPFTLAEVQESHTKWAALTWAALMVRDS